MKSEDFCDLILSIDKKVRYVGVYLNEIFSYKVQKNTVQYFTDDENSISVKTEVVRASLRRYLAEKVGEPIYAMTKYPKVSLVTLHFMETNLVLISMEPDADHNYIIGKALEILKAHGSSLE